MGMGQPNLSDIEDVVRPADQCTHCFSDLWKWQGALDDEYEEEGGGEDEFDSDFDEEVCSYPETIT